MIWIVILVIIAVIIAYGILLSEIGSDIVVNLPSDKITTLKKEQLLLQLRPEHRDYSIYNPSILYRKETNDFYLFFRVSTFSGCSGSQFHLIFDTVVYEATMSLSGIVSNINLVDLPYEQMIHCNDNGQLIHSYSNTSNVQFNHGVEDARAFWFKGEVWGAASVNGINEKHSCTPSMSFWKASFPRETFRVIPNMLVLIEKNWSPFEYEGKLLFEYSINPHVILEVNTETGEMTTLCQTTSLIPNLRGSGCPIKVMYDDKECYLNIGHVHRSAKVQYVSLETTIGININRPYNRDYYHMFYIFESVSPFKIIGIGKEFKLGNSYEQIQFAAGLTRYEDNIIVSYGIEDCYPEIIWYNLGEILKSIS